MKEDGMTEPLVACHECDLLQREVPVPRGGIVRCVRCNAVLYRSHPDSFERTLALTAGGIVLFAIANSFPLIGLKIQGQLIETTLFQTVQTLWNEDMKSVGMLVFATTMLMPGLQLARSLIYCCHCASGGRRRISRSSIASCNQCGHGAWSKCSCSVCWFRS